MITIRREQRAHDGRAHGGGALDVFAQGRDGLRVRFRRARQQTTAARLKAQAQILRPRAHFGPVLRIHHALIERVLQENRVELVPRDVVKKLAVVPTLEAETIRIEPESPGTRG